MGSAARMRASDQDRNEAVLALGEHHASGRITLPEFTARMEVALSCSYLDELDPLFADLPARPRELAPVAPVHAHRGGPPFVVPPHAHRSGRPPGVMLAVPVLAVFAALTLGAGILFPLWLPILLIWVLGGARGSRRMRRSTCVARQVHGPRGW